MANKTKNLIIDSFLELVAKSDEEPEKISITDIVEHCNISRQTFYYHFKDIDQMLEWAFQNEYDAIEKELEKYNNWQDIVLVFSASLTKYSVFLKKCLNSRMFVDVYSMLNNFIYEIYKKFFQKKCKNPLDDYTLFMVNACAYTMIGFVIKELKKENPDFYAMTSSIKDTLNKK